MLVEHFHSTGRMQDAYTYVREFEERRVPIHPYVEIDVLNAVYSAVGVNTNKRGGGGGGGRKAAAGSDDDEPYVQQQQRGGGGGGGGGASKRDDDDEVDDEIGEVSN